MQQRRRTANVQSATQRHPQRRVPGDVQDYVTTQCDKGKSPAQIHDGLKRSLAAQNRGGDLPSRRTVERMVKDLETRDSSELWSLGIASLEEAALVPPVWAAFARLRSDRTVGLKQREAELAARIATAVPDLRRWDVWRLVVAYMRREDRKIDTGDLDFLAGSAGEWCRAELDIEQREKARYAHFLRHRDLWPDREYLYVFGASEAGGWEAFFFAVKKAKDANLIVSVQELTGESDEVLRGMVPGITKDAHPDYYWAAILAVHEVSEGTGDGDLQDVRVTVEVLNEVLSTERS